MSLHGIYKTFSQTLKYFRKCVVGATVNTEEQDFLPKQFTQKTTRSNPIKQKL